MENPTISNIAAATAKNSPKVVFSGRKPTPSECARVVMACERKGTWLTSLRRFKHRPGLGMVLDPHGLLGIVEQTMRNGDIPDDYCHFDVFQDAKDKRGHYDSPQAYFARKLLPESFDRPAYLLDSVNALIEEVCGRRILVHPDEGRTNEDTALKYAVEQISRGCWSGVPAVLRSGAGSRVFRVAAVAPTRCVDSSRTKLILMTQDQKKFVLNVPPGLTPIVGRGSLLQRGDPFFRAVGTLDGPVLEALKHTIHARTFYNVDTQDGPVEYIRLWNATAVAHRCPKCLTFAGVHPAGKDITCCGDVRVVPALKQAMVLANARHYIFDARILSEKNSNVQDIEDISHVRQFDRQHADTALLVEAARVGGYKVTPRLPQIVQNAQNAQVA